MRVPNIERAVVEPAKIRDYLLSGRHPVGRFKAAFFRTLGYEELRWQEFERDLRAHLASEAADIVQGPFGIKVVVRGSLVA